MWTLVESLKDHLGTIVALVTALVAMYKWIAVPLKKLLDRDKAQDNDISMILWDRLCQAHNYYMTRGWATSEEKERLITMHKAYQDRGRNHLSSSFEQDLLKLPEHPANKGGN